MAAFLRNHLLSVDRYFVANLRLNPFKHSCDRAVAIYARPWIVRHVQQGRTDSRGMYLLL